MKAALRMTGLSILFALLLAISAFAAWRAWDRAHTLYPTPETESAFLKNCTPQHVIEQFQCRQSSSHAGPGGGGEAGEKSVTHNGGFDWFFAMRSDKRSLPMTALNNDVDTQLTLNGAQILNRSRDDADRTHAITKIS